MIKPFLSYKTLTYGRVSFLQEALHSFLIQDYPDSLREMVIVNDYPLQELVFDHPRVKIYNLDRTFDFIGEKENFTIERCSGELIVTADDDDVALAGHSNNIAKYWRKGATLLRWGRGAYYNEPGITSLTEMGNSGMVYSKEAWEQIGKSPVMNAGGDMELVMRLKKLGNDKVVLASPPDEEISWFYMWGGRGFHQSGAGTDDGKRPNIVQRHTKYIESLRKKGEIPTGRIVLQPRWNHDYQTMLNKYINGRK